MSGASRLGKPDLDALRKDFRFFKPSPRPLFDLALKIRLAGEQGWRCCDCGVRMELESGPNQATYEHVIPRSIGGTDCEANLVVCCFKCNMAANARFNRMLPHEMLAWVADRLGVPELAPVVAFLTGRMASHMHQTDPKLAKALMDNRALSIRIDRAIIHQQTLKDQHKASREKWKREVASDEAHPWRTALRVILQHYLDRYPKLKRKPVTLLFRLCRIPKPGETT